MRCKVCLKIVKHPAKITRALRLCGYCQKKVYTTTKTFSTLLRSIRVVKRIGKNIETQNYRVTPISDYQHNIIMNKQTVSIFLNTSEVV